MSWRSCLLVIALFSLGWQVVKYFQGPDMHFLDPEQVTFFIQPEKDGRSHIEIVTDFTFFNDGDPQYSGMIKGESVQFQAGGKTRRELRWQNFGKWVGD